jgi:hypothetical protein
LPAAPVMRMFFIFSLENFDTLVARCRSTRTI